MLTDFLVKLLSVSTTLFNCINEDIRVGGATTGDDSGMYPDSVLEKYVRYNGFPQNTYGHRTASIHLSPGTYRLRLFCSLNSTYKNSTEFMKVQTVVLPMCLNCRTVMMS